MVVEEQIILLLPSMDLTEDQVVVVDGAVEQVVLALQDKVIMVVMVAQETLFIQQEVAEVQVQQVKQVKLK